MNTKNIIPICKNCINYKSFKNYAHCVLQKGWLIYSENHPFG